MRLLIVYHMGASEAAQPMFAALAKQPRVDLHVFAPKLIRTSGWGTWAFDPNSTGGLAYGMSAGRLLFPHRYGESVFLTGILRTMRRFRPDAIQVLDEAHSYLTCQALVYRDLFLRTSKVGFYAFENLDLAQDWHGMLGALRRTAQRYVLRQADIGLCASQEAMRLLQAKGYPQQKLRRVFWGVDLENLHPFAQAGARRKLGLQEDFLIGYVGRLVEEKGLLLLFDAFKMISDKGGTARLLFLGDGPLRSQLEQRAKEGGIASRVIFRASVPPSQVISFIRAFDVLVLPSLTRPHWKEQFGRVLVEAMACGVPVVGSSSGAIPEVTGDGGLVFAEGDVRDLQSKLERLRTDSLLRAGLAKQARCRAEREFSWDIFA